MKNISSTGSYKFYLKNKIGIVNVQVNFRLIVM